MDCAALPPARHACAGAAPHPHSTTAFSVAETLFAELPLESGSAEAARRPSPAVPSSLRTCVCRAVDWLRLRRLQQGPAHHPCCAESCEWWRLTWRGVLSRGLCVCVFVQHPRRHHGAVEPCACAQGRRRGRISTGTQPPTVSSVIPCVFLRISYAPSLGVFDNNKCHNLANLQRCNLGCVSRSVHFFFTCSGFRSDGFLRWTT